MRGDIGDRAQVEALLRDAPAARVVNFAAETHVDRSIHGPAAFVETNVVGTFALLDAVKAWWTELPAAERRDFRFLHVSTDEVYGSLGPDDPAFSGDDALRAEQPVLGLEGRLAITSCARTITRTACRCSPPTARTTTGRASFPRSSFR